MPVYLFYAFTLGLLQKAMATFGAARAAAYDAHQRREHYRSQVMGLSAFERHQKFVRDYVEHYGGAGGSKGGAAVQVRWGRQ